jgi:hypothetical protein
MGWTVRGSDPCGGAIFRSRPDRSQVPPSLLYKGYQVFRGVKAAGSFASGLELYLHLSTATAEKCHEVTVTVALYAYRSYCYQYLPVERT